MHNRLILAAVLAALSLPAMAGNSNGCQGNCPSDGGDTATATGGDATAYGGNATSNAAAGAVAGAAANAVASVGDVTNVAHGGAGGHSTAIAAGGEGGKGGMAYGGSAHQGQSQGQQQGQHQTNVGINGQQQSAASDQSQSSENRNTNTATNAGNSQQVGGQSTSIKFEDVANAPPVFLGNITATMSCAGGFNAGGSSQDGAGAFGFSWVSADCRTVVIGKEFAGIGMPDVACRVWKTTKGYKRAVKADPSLANVDCSPKPVVPPQAMLAPRTPRG